MRSTVVSLVVLRVERITGFQRPPRLAVSAFLSAVQCLAPRSASRVKRIANDLIGDFRLHLGQVHQECHVCASAEMSFGKTAKSLYASESFAVSFAAEFAHAK